MTFNEDNPYIELMTVIHIDGWDYLECPMCNEDLYMRSFQRCENPMIIPFCEIENGE